MPRYKDSEWAIPEIVSLWDHAVVAVLMDIRDELQTLNKVFRCTNALAIPTLLRRIENNTALLKTRKRKKAK